MSELELRQTTIDAEIAHAPAARRRQRLRLPRVGTILAGAFVVFLLVALVYVVMTVLTDLAARIADPRLAQEGAR